MSNGQSKDYSREIYKAYEGSGMSIYSNETTKFVRGWDWVQDIVHETAKEKGWWDTDRNDGELIALMHSELSECLEALRKPGDSEHIPDFTGVEEELADVIIRIMDFAGARKLMVAAAILAKIEFNKSRPVKHGGKKF
jgi:NTP pyrophosphatase (non-canonical NTP hydrolase)